MLYGGEQAYFSSLCTKDEQHTILNLEHGRAVTDWGRIIFYVSDVDAVWTHLTEKGFNPAKHPQTNGICVSQVLTQKPQARDRRAKRRQRAYPPS